MKTTKFSVHLNCGVMYMDEQSVTEQSQTDQSTSANQSTISNIDFVDMREHTLIETKEGNIVVIHEITLGDIVISVLIAATLIFMFLERMMRR